MSPLMSPIAFMGDPGKRFEKDEVFGAGGTANGNILLSQQQSPRSPKRTRSSGGTSYIGLLSPQQKSHIKLEPLQEDKPLDRQTIGRPTSSTRGALGSPRESDERSPRETDLNSDNIMFSDDHSGLGHDLNHARGYTETERHKSRIENTLYGNFYDEALAVESDDSAIHWEEKHNPYGYMGSSHHYESEHSSDPWGGYNDGMSGSGTDSNSPRDRRNRGFKYKKSVKDSDLEFTWKPNQFQHLGEVGDKAYYFATHETRDEGYTLASARKMLPDQPGKEVDSYARLHLYPKERTSSSGVNVLIAMERHGVRRDGSPHYD